MGEDDNGHQNRNPQVKNLLIQHKSNYEMFLIASLSYLILLVIPLLIQPPREPFAL